MYSSLVVIVQFRPGLGLANHVLCCLEEPQGIGCDDSLYEHVIYVPIVTGTSVDKYRKREKSRETDIGS